MIREICLHKRRYWKECWFTISTTWPQTKFRCHLDSGKRIVSVYSTMHLLFNKHFGYLWCASDTKRESWLYTFSPCCLHVPRYWDLVSAPLFHRWSSRGHRDCLPIHLLLVWLFLPGVWGSTEHLLPLWTICLRFISYFSDSLFTITLIEFSSISFFQKQEPMRFSVPFSSLLALFLCLKELIYSQQFHFTSFSAPEWLASS